MEHGLSVHPLLVSTLLVRHTQIDYQNYLPNEVKKYSCEKFLYLDVGYTDNGDRCKNRCQFYDQEYNWCWTVDGDYYWDYCTPNGEFCLYFFHEKQSILWSFCFLKHILYRSLRYLAR